MQCMYLQNTLFVYFGFTHLIFIINFTVLICEINSTNYSPATIEDRGVLGLVRLASGPRVLGCTDAGDLIEGHF